MLYRLIPLCLVGLMISNSAAQTATIPPGNFMLLNSVEYQVPIRANDNIYVVEFVDPGTVTSRINAIDDYRVSVGFGARFVVPMLGPVPIPLDFGFPIVKGPNDKEHIFNFWMGFFR